MEHGEEEERSEASPDLEWDPESWICFLNVMIDIARTSEMPDVRTRLASAVYQWPETAGDIPQKWMNDAWDFLQCHYPLFGEPPGRTMPMSRVRIILGEDVPIRVLFCACIAPWNVPKLEAVFPMPYFPATVAADEECKRATPSQLNALNTILLEMSRMPEYRRHRSFMLEGGAGVGKSWTVRTLYRLLGRNAIVTATTASAAQTLDISSARTVHSTMGIGMGERKDFVSLLSNLKTRTWSTIVQAMAPGGSSRYSNAHTDMMDILDMYETDVGLSASRPLWILDEVSMMGASLLDTCLRSWLASLSSARTRFLYKHAFSTRPFDRRITDIDPPAYNIVYMPQMDELDLETVGWPVNWRPPPDNADATIKECYQSLWRTFYERTWRFIPPILFVGDFYQLPPIKDEYAFTSVWWKEQLKPTRLVLIEPVRQKGDLAYHDFLEKLRTGKLSSTEMFAWWQRFLRAPKDKVPEAATYLHSRNNDADQTNAVKLKALNRTVYMVRSTDTGNEQTKKQFESALPEIVQVAVGAQIILRRNMDQAQGLVNGTRATILGIGQFDSDGSTKGYESHYTRLPFRQGQYKWLDHSRPECLGDQLAPSNSHASLDAPRVFIEIELIKDQRRFYILPACIKMTSRPTRKRKNPTDEDLEEVVAQRIQLPMILGWAVSIHRSQGMTLIDGAHIDARNMFSPGQGYVAFSRVPSADLVHLVNTPSGAGTRPSPAVVQYYQSLAQQQ